MVTNISKFYLLISNKDRVKIGSIFLFKIHKNYTLVLPEYSLNSDRQVTTMDLQITYY